MSTVLANNRPCPDCTIVIPDNKGVCPHCGRPSRPLNVLCADRTDELSALDSEFDRAIHFAGRAGTDSETQAFLTFCVDSKAIFCAPFRTLLPVVTQHVDLFADFYKLADLRCQSPELGKRDWHMLRNTAEAFLVEGKPKDLEILYAALSINGKGLESYGECTLILNPAMTGHRATVFPDNSALYFERNPGKPAAGMRARWQDRHKLCIIKNVRDIRAGMDFDAFCELLLRQSEDRLSDRLVEVHVTGPISMRAFEKIRLPNPVSLKTRAVMFLGISKDLPRPDRMYFDACKKMCGDNLVSFESY